MKNSWAFPAAALVVGAIGGYVSGSNKSATGDSAGGGDAVVRTHSSNRADGQAGGETAAGGKRASRARSLEEIARMPGNMDRIKALMEFYAGLSPSQLAEEARKLESLPMNERMMASVLLFGRWAESDPTAAMAFSNTMGFAGAFVRPTILQSWASADPANAAKYYAANPREFAMMGMMGGGRGPMGGGQQGPASIIASEWARQDPAAALAWAGTLTTDQSQAMNAVIGAVAQTDPLKAAGMVASMTGTDKGDAYRAVASKYGALDFNAAQAWVRTLPAEEQAAAMASAIGGLANTDPQSAAQQVKLMAAGDAKDSAAAIVAGDLARVSPQAAADFIKQQDSEKAQQNSMRPLMSTWAAQDPTAALAYANTFQAGAVRDSALLPYIMSNNTAAPSDLVKVAETVTDAGNRDRALGMAAARWMREDSVAATAYVQQSTTLSENAKQRILSGRGFGGGRPPGP